mmetsp:Transcript_126048/g.245903  ORF Transcript_126048/g.245903 Transcript_126048/m.245903 type:complete len:105 (-) Transcript_126048:821-1135(-)
MQKQGSLLPTPGHSSWIMVRMRRMVKKKQKHVRLVDDTGLCYFPPDEGYSCKATICNENCGGIFSTNCGFAACASNSEACGKNIATMVVSGLEAAVSSALLVAT